LDGIANNLVSPEPTEENVYQLDEKSLTSKHISLLPTSFWEALDEFKKSELIREILGEHLFERYLGIKTREWSEFKTQVTSWERDKYLDV